MEGFHPRRPLGDRLQDFSCSPYCWPGHLPGMQCRPSPSKAGFSPSSPTQTHEEAQAPHFHTSPQRTGAQTLGTQTHTSVPTFPV